MQDNNSSFRTTLSLFFSTLLHGGIIAMIAIGPAYLKGVMDGKGSDLDSNANSGTAQVEISVNDMGAPPVEVQPTQPTVSEVAEIKEPTAIVEKKVAPPKKMAALPVKKNPAKAKKIVPVDFSQAQESDVVVKEELPAKTIEAEPSLPYEDEVDEKVAEIANDKVESVDAKPDSEEQIAQTEEVAKTPVVESEPVNNNSSAKEQISEQKPATAEPPVASANKNTDGENLSKESTGANAASSGVVAASGNGADDGLALASAQSGKPVTQNYLELQQVPGNKPPKYTPEMRIKKLQGRGQLVYYVSKNGEVTNLKVIKSSGSAELDNAAVQAFSKYKFVPGQDGYTAHDFEFVLKGPAEASAARLRTTSR